MTRRVLTHHDASAELFDAVRWYESKRVGVGTALLERVADTVARAAQAPKIGTPLSVDHNTRRLLVPSFPYQVIYRVRPDTIVIVAVAHMKRRPGYWKNRR